MRPLVTFEGDTMVLPGLVTAHSHAFQRALRGSTQRAPRDTGSFWSWREAMYRVADGLTPESIGAISRRAFEELRRAGVVAVGEFHYVHHQPGGTPYEDRTTLADAVIQAALDAGLRITLLRTAYARAGAGREPEGAQRRFCDASVSRVLDDLDALRSRWSRDARVRIGVAPHSVRAVPASWIRALHDYATKHAMPFHMHVAEVEGEITRASRSTSAAPWNSWPSAACSTRASSPCTRPTSSRTRLDCSVRPARSRACAPRRSATSETASQTSRPCAQRA